ncbi:hypothetical protein F4779DRAFT_560756 [Xylariaceae sp. FL0662B]|nr:hypothetical protein F4779DRAFT_560756 [Xylariaceae sp. FL0662B]
MFQNVLSIILQLCLATVALAVPVATEEITTAGPAPWHYGTGGGIVGFIILVLDIIVFIEVLKSNRPATDKLIWCLVVFFFPIVGMVVYFLFSNRKAHNTYEPLP